MEYEIIAKFKNGEVITLGYVDDYEGAICMADDVFDYAPLIMETEVYNIKENRSEKSFSRD